MIIFATSINYVRRKHFNAFYFSHYAFVGFYAFAWVHVPQSQPFLATGMLLYGADKFLRVLWSGVPTHTTVFRNKGDGIAQVRPTLLLCSTPTTASLPV